MQRPKVQRKYDIVDRFVHALIVLIPWSIIGTGSTGIFGSIFVAAILVMLAEFSFEMVNNEVKIRSSGKFYDLWIFGYIVWIPMKVLSIIGVTNFPLGVMAGTAFFGYMMFAGYQIFDILVHLILLWYLYYMRKVNK